MTIEKIYSTIQDNNIMKDIINSPIWKECYHSDDIRPANAIFCYTIKFDGLIPVQVTQVEVLV